MLCICSYKTPTGAVTSLQAKGFEVITLPCDPSLPAEVNYHTDLMIFILEDVIIVREEYYKIAKNQIDAICLYSGLELRLSHTHAGDIYPDDCGLCAAISGKNIICRTMSTDSEIIKLANEKGYNIINVSQGYARCSCAVLADGSVVTADPGIKKRLAREGIDTLLVSPGAVELPGYEYGFIGGSSGVHEDVLYFCGKIDAHPDIIEINQFAQKHSTRLVSLSDAMLFDIGSFYFTN